MPTLSDRVTDITLRLSSLSPRGRMRLTVALAAVAFLSLAASAIISVTQYFGDPVDFSTFGPPGARILTGHWNGIFADRIIQAGVWELIFWGIPELLGVGGAVGWATFSIIAGSLTLAILAWIVERPLRALAGTWSAPFAAAICALVAIAGGSILAILDGHPAQLAIPLLWLAAGLAARDARPLLAASLIGLSTGWEVWGVLGAPILLLAPRIDRRTIWRTALGVAGVVALLFVPFVLLGPFRMFEFAWNVNPRSLAGILLPGVTHFPWPLRLTQGVLSLAGGAAVALLLRRRVDAIWLAPLAVCAIRLLFDPVLTLYYGVAPCVLVLVGLVFSVAQRSVWAAVACLLIVNALVDLVQFAVLGKAVTVVLVAALTVVVVRSRASSARDVLATEPPHRHHAEDQGVDQR